MGIKTAYSSKENIEDIIADINRQVESDSAKMVIYFASSGFDHDLLGDQMQKRFGKAAVFGCSTAGEIVSGKMLKQSVVAMIFDPESIDDVKVEIVENIRAENRIPEAFERFEAYFGTPMSELDFETHVGIILVDGLSGAEEKLMDKIGDLTDISFIGASAGDDLQFKETRVYANGKSHTNAAVLALIKPSAGFDVLKTQSFCALNKNLKATLVDEANRKVVEFNGKPAAQAYAEALGVSVEDASNQFMNHPVGLMFGDEPYVRSPQQIQGDHMVFYCNIKKNMDLMLLESTDIVEDTRLAIEQLKSDLPNISGIINFHCILRTLELEQKNQTEPYGHIFKDIPTIGFSTYGEEYIGHINQTSTMLIFK